MSTVFYELGYGLTRQFARYVEVRELEQVLCPANEGHRGPGRPLSDLNVIWRGKKVPDILWTWLSECLLTEHSLELFRSKGFTGFDVKPVKASFPRAEQKPTRLWELVLTGWAGMAPPESGIRITEKCDACGYRRYSGCDNPDKLIAVSQWDGSDFFMVWPLPRYIWVTQRVVDTIREYRLKGAVLKRPEELSFSSSGFGPGRLIDWMPEERARELGKPLGIC
ncbi:MAG: hypothetical protein JXL80_06505 [Planctomycetes bacterium]|nr:hypothetical protein [Planctomycetota bacterium]